MGAPLRRLEEASYLYAVEYNYVYNSFGFTHVYDDKLDCGDGGLVNFAGEWRGDEVSYGNGVGCGKSTAHQEWEKS